MNVEIYLAFVLAATLLIVAPGPSVMVVVAHAMTAGWRRSLSTIGGEAAAHLVYIVLTALGISSALLAFAGIFSTLKWIGAACLVLLGLRQWMSAPPEEVPPEARPRALRSMFAQGFAVTITNPKAIVFYAAFFTPFLDPARPLLLQFLILGATFLAIFVVASIAYAVVAERGRIWARSRTYNRISGSILIGAGLALVAARRS